MADVPGCQMLPLLRNVAYRKPSAETGFPKLWCSIRRSRSRESRGIGTGAPARRPSGPIRCPQRHRKPSASSSTDHRSVRPATTRHGRPPPGGTSIGSHCSGGDGCPGRNPGHVYLASAGSDARRGNTTHLSSGERCTRSPLNPSVFQDIDRRAGHDVVQTDRARSTRRSALRLSDAKPRTPHFSQIRCGTPRAVSTTNPSPNPSSAPLEYEIREPSGDRVALTRRRPSTRVTRMLGAPSKCFAARLPFRPAWCARRRGSRRLESCWAGP